MPFPFLDEKIAQLGLMIRKIAYFLNYFYILKKINVHSQLKTIQEKGLRFEHRKALGYGLSFNANLALSCESDQIKKRSSMQINYQHSFSNGLILGLLASWDGLL